MWKIINNLKKIVEVISEFSKAVRNKTNIQKHQLFFYVIAKIFKYIKFKIFVHVKIPGVI